MKKILFLISVFFYAAAVFSQDKNANFSVALETSSYTYSEPSLGVKLSGPKYGISAEYLARNAQKGGLFAAAQLGFMTGNVDYNGYVENIATRVVTPHSVGGIKDYYFEGRFLLGFAAADSGSASSFWPYLGIGYRRLFNGMGVDAYGYDRTSTYIYLPAGVRARFKMPRGWELSPSAEYNIFLGGTQESALPGETIIKNQDEGYGLRASIRVSKNLGRAAFFLEPFYRYWNISQSDWVYSYYLSSVAGTPMYASEPANNTTEFGLKIGASF